MKVVGVLLVALASASALSSSARGASVTLSGSVPTESTPRVSRNEAQKDWGDIWSLASKSQAEQRAAVGTEQQRKEAAAETEAELKAKAKADKKASVTAESKAAAEKEAKAKEGVAPPLSPAAQQEDKLKNLLGAANADGDKDKELASAHKEIEALKATKPAAAAGASAPVSSDAKLTPEQKWKLAGAFAVVGVILGAVLVFGKLLVSQLYQNATETLRPAVAAMFHEMTLFGMMGCFGYMLLRSKALEQFNITFMGSAGTLVTTMMYDIGAVLLAALVFFFFFSVQLIVFAINIKKKWREWEKLALYTTEKSHRARKTTAQKKLDTQGERGACCGCGLGRSTEDVKGYSYRLTRKGFISRDIGRHGVLAQDFDMAAYLEVPLGETLTATIAVSPVSMLFICLTVGVANVLIGASFHWQIAIFSTYAVLGVVFTYIVRLRLDGMRKNLYIKDPLVNGVVPHPTPQMLSEGVTGDYTEGKDPVGKDDSWKNSNVEHKQHGYLWGGEYGGAVLHSCYRVSLLWATLYSALYILMVCVVLPKETSIGWAVGLGFLLLPPPFIMTHLLAGSVEDHAMFCSIEFMRREDVVDQVINKNRLIKGRQAVRLVRAMHVVAEHKRLWHLETPGAGPALDAGADIPHLKNDPKNFMTHLLLHMIRKGFAVVQPNGQTELGMKEVWHMLRWLGYDLTEFEVKYLCHAPPKRDTGDPDVARPRTINEGQLLDILRKLIVIHHNFEMLENVVTAAVREEYLAANHNAALQNDMGRGGQAPVGITVADLRRDWLHKQVEEDIVANLLLRYTRDHNTVRSIRREYRLMVNEPMDAVDAAAEIKCRFTASKLARLLKEQMEYVNSCCQSKVGPTLLSQRAGRS